jgi:hypothetical protein
MSLIESLPRIAYPKKAEVEQQDATSFHYGRTIAVKYRRV